MNFEFVSSVPLWYWIACILITFAAIIVGFYFVYLKQSKALTAIVNSADARSSGAGAQSTISDEAKWPVADDGPSRDLKSDGRDPVEYCTHIQSQIKQTQHRLAQEKVMSKLSQKQQEEEREIQRRQLEDIFRLMEEHKEKFGVSDVSDVKEQLKLYVQ